MNNIWIPLSAGAVACLASLVALVLAAFRHFSRGAEERSVSDVVARQGVRVFDAGDVSSLPEETTSTRGRLMGHVVPAFHGRKEAADILSTEGERSQTPRRREATMTRQFNVLDLKVALIESLPPEEIEAVITRLRLAETKATSDSDDEAEDR